MLLLLWNTAFHVLDTQMLNLIIILLYALVILITYKDLSKCG